MQSGRVSPRSSECRVAARPAARLPGACVLQLTRCDTLLPSPRSVGKQR